ncbi:MAG: ATP-binding protein [Melioribacteraceae bacterium]|jgi:serine/threonine-protein kinase RsbW|nr:ATP-binding protein [Melioribacteraceae bacterium]
MAINKFSITSEYHNISTVSRKIKSFLKEEKVDKEISDPVLISLMEALNNSIEHSYLEKPGNNIDIIVGITKTKIEVDILETGIKRTNFDKPTLKFDPDDLSTAPEGGMGLYIMDTLMDSISYSSENGVNRTSFYKKRI